MSESPNISAVARLEIDPHVVSGWLCRMFADVHPALLDSIECVLQGCPDGKRLWQTISGKSSPLNDLDSITFSRKLPFRMKGQEITQNIIFDGISFRSLDPGLVDLARFILSEEATPNEVNQLISAMVAYGVLRHYHQKVKKLDEDSPAFKIMFSPRQDLYGLLWSLEYVWKSEAKYRSDNGWQYIVRVLQNISMMRFYAITCALQSMHMQIGDLTGVMWWSIVPKTIIHKDLTFDTTSRMENQIIHLKATQSDIFTMYRRSSQYQPYFGVAVYNGYMLKDSDLMPFYWLGSIERIDPRTLDTKERLMVVRALHDLGFLEFRGGAYQRCTKGPIPAQALLTSTLFTVKPTFFERFPL